MEKSFVQSVLSTKKQRQAFYYFRGIVSLLCAVAVFKMAPEEWSIILAGAGLVVSYLTVAPVIAFIICLAEQMFS